MKLELALKIIILYDLKIETSNSVFCIIEFNDRYIFDLS